MIKIYFIQGMGQVVAEEKEGVFYNAFYMSERLNKETQQVQTVFSPINSYMEESTKIDFKPYAILGDMEAPPKVVKMYNEMKTSLYSGITIVDPSKVSHLRQSR